MDTSVNNMISTIGLVAAVVLPFFNIPLIVKMIKRRSSQDISLYWVVGVWVCIVFMAPSGFISKDIVWRVFNYLNVLFFTCVMVTAIKYRKGKA